MDSEREAIIAQMVAMDEAESGVPAQASVTPEGADHAAPTGDEAVAESGKEAEPEGEQKGETDKPDKAAKEEARKEKSWAEINRRKAEIEAKAKALADREAEIERLRVEAAERAATAGKYTPEDFEAAANRFEAEGDDGMAKQARERANQLRHEVAAQKEKEQRQRMENEWKSAVAKAKDDHPELNDPESPLTKTMNEVLKNRPTFMTYPGGVQDAVVVAQLKLKADSVEALQKELDELRAKAEAQEKKLQPGGSTPVRPESEKTWDTLSTKEQGNLLLRMAMEADASGRGAEALSSF